MIGSFLVSSSFVNIAATSYSGSTSFLILQNSFGFARSYSARNPLKSLGILLSPRTCISFLRIENVMNSKLFFGWGRGFVEIAFYHKREVCVLLYLLDRGSRLKSFKAHHAFSVVKAQDREMGDDLERAARDQARLLPGIAAIQVSRTRDKIHFFGQPALLVMHGDADL